MATSSSIPKKRAREDDEKENIRCTCDITGDSYGSEVYECEFCIGILDQDESRATASMKSFKKTNPTEIEDLSEEVVTKSISFPLTDECQHYSHVSEVPWDIQKYWHQRHKIFSLCDEGIQLTDELWFGVSPEPVARQIATEFTTKFPPTKKILIDIFAGAGGNIIAFALSNRWKQIIAVEKGPSAIACAQHNAKIYGVDDKITWINQDCFSYLSSTSIDPSKTVIFASPPWGGPGYRTDEIFNLDTMLPYSLKYIRDACKKMDLAIYLPRTSDLRQIAKFAENGKTIDVVQMCMDGASKALLAYISAESR